MYEQSKPTLTRGNLWVLTKVFCRQLGRWAQARVLRQRRKCDGEIRDAMAIHEFADYVAVHFSGPPDRQFGRIRWQLHTTGDPMMQIFGLQAVKCDLSSARGGLTKDTSDMFCIATGQQPDDADTLVREKHL